MEGITIRMARRGDGAGLAELHLNTAAGLRELDSSRFRIPDTEGLVEWLDADLTTMGETWICFVAEDDGQIVGQVEAMVHQPMESAKFQVTAELGMIRGEVNSLGVLASYRRRGIGRALMAHAEDWLRGRGARVIRLDTFLNSDESVSFYDAIGYTRTAIIFERNT
jgi:ribosomal protein S18 acetylase RimI-like enzyme